MILFAELNLAFAAQRTDASLFETIARREALVQGAELREVVESARAELSRLETLARACERPLEKADATPWIGCVLAQVFGADGMAPADETMPAAANSVLQALANRRGSCDTLSLSAMLVGESLGLPLEALILREHVVLGVRGRNDAYFETLDGGQRHSAFELHRHRMPPNGRAERLSLRGYLPYHLDNFAVRLAQAGDSIRAEAALREAIALAPQPARFRYNIGTLLLELGRYAEARDQLRTAIRRGWDDADAWVNRGVAESRLGRLRDAKRSFKRALGQDPTNQRARANLRAVEAEMDERRIR